MDCLPNAKRGRLSLKLRRNVQPCSGKQCKVPGESMSQADCSSDGGQMFSSTCGQPYSGLSNLGNTCYCNAVLQALRHCPGFSTELKRTAHDFFLPFGEIHLIQKLSQLIQEMEDSVDTVTPTTFLDMLSDQFASKVQHDAQELLNYLLSQIQTLLVHGKRKASTPTLEELPEKLLKTGKGEAHCNSSQYLPECSAHNTPINALFQGKLTFLTRCFDCDKYTRRTEPFVHVSVPVTCSGLPGFLGSSDCSTGSSTAPVSLSWCLSQFMCRERLAWSNKFWCDYCGHLVEAERSTIFSALPQIFTVHLNRFSVQDWGRSVGKVAGSVAIPLTLDLMPWSSKDCTPRSSVYYLQAVVLHSGASCHSGHYTAVVWVSGQWLLCDDETVQQLSDTTMRELLSPLPTSTASPYILFYCRLSCM